MTRAVPEWIGKTPDTPVPPRVRLRVFDRHEGRDYITGVKIKPGDEWQLDHVTALKNGGENRESNLAPVLAANHKAKSRKDVAEKSKVYRQRAKHVGAMVKRSPAMKGPGFAKAPDMAKADRIAAKHKAHMAKRKIG